MYPVKKVNILLALLLSVLFVTTSCNKTEEFEDLEYNIFDDPSVELFEFVGVEFEPAIGVERHVRFSFTSKYNELKESHKDRILRIAVIESNFANFDPERDFFYLRFKDVGETVCANIHFLLAGGQLSRGSTFCVEVE